MKINYSEEFKNKEIKKILNTGVITTGNSSENIDFTIIIGKDY